MNNRVLLAWELGGGRGHAHIAGWVACALKRRGFEPILAVQQLEAIQSISTDLGDTRYLQAPVWPGVIRSRSYASPGINVTLGDVLAEAGIRSPAATRHMLRAWDELLALLKPAAVVADYAPGVLLAARGRLPTVAVGEGFTLPPSAMESFPHLVDDAVRPKYAESDVLESVNSVLRESSRAQLSYLPEVFSADRSCTAAFTEFDAYRDFRRQPNAGPWVPEWDRTVVREGNELFGYFSIQAPFQTVIVRALMEVVKSGISVRVHMPQLGAEALSLLEEVGIVVERAPVPFADIQRRSRLVVSLGSLSFVACALVAGLPQIIFPLGISKYVAGDAIGRIGSGRSINIDEDNPLEPALLAQAMIEAFGDDALSARAKEVAPNFNRRLEPRPDEHVVRLVEELIGAA
jgi:rhamnosyltransferase subunit B